MNACIGEIEKLNAFCHPLYVPTCFPNKKFMGLVSCVTFQLEVENKIIEIFNISFLMK